MSGKRLRLEEEFSTKRAKYDKCITTILGADPMTKQWLVEWSDMTRTWESYDGVKNFDAFRRFVEELALEQKRKHRDIPFYIN